VNCIYGFECVSYVRMECDCGEARVCLCAGLSKRIDDDSCLSRARMDALHRIDSYGMNSNAPHVSHARLAMSISSIMRPSMATMAESAFESNIIDKSQYVSNPQAAGSSKSNEGVVGNHESKRTNTTARWTPTELRTVPAFYPLEKSSRLVEDDTAAAIAARVCDCLRHLSVQAVYDNDTACLWTAENVEMHLSLWKTPPNSVPSGIVVELQRRSGDSMAFHRYARSLLDAAMGLVEVDALPIPDDIIYSKKVQRLLWTELRKNSEVGDGSGSTNSINTEYETAIQAIEIAHGLLMKDRMDARVLGLESLCLLSDPRKTGFVTSMLTSHVVLLGSVQGVEIPGVVMSDSYVDEGPFQEIRTGILNLVQFKRIGEDDEYEDAADMDADKEHLTLLHNLALAVLANSLDCIEQNPERSYADFSNAVEGENLDVKPRARMRTASSTEVANEFMQQTEELSKKEILSTLISELGKAADTPHNAVLSAKCIGSLCRASDEAKKRAKELGAKQVVSTALDVGVRTHLKLETECERVVTVLERTASEEDGTREEDEDDAHAMDRE
jgi:hypothetical protein